MSLLGEEEKCTVDRGYEYIIWAIYKEAEDGKWGSLTDDNALNVLCGENRVERDVTEFCMRQSALDGRGRQLLFVDEKVYPLRVYKSIDI